MSVEFRADDFTCYQMDYAEPFEQLESEGSEIEVVKKALVAMCNAGILPHMQYSHEAFHRHRDKVRASFQIPWTAISPRMERLIYAINAIRQPQHMIAAGVFCGFTFICNAGGGTGPGACYEPEDLVGVEIDAEKAKMARSNINNFDTRNKARIVTGDAVDFVRKYDGPIDLLYLDADGGEARGKDIYLDILQAGRDKMPEGSVVLAHNSVNCRQQLARYLEYVRSQENFRESMNVMLDPDGLEVSLR